MKLSTKPYKGMRDYYPEDMRVRNWVFSVWKTVCTSFGYEEYDGPTLEPLELYASKTSEEIVNEQTYSFIDRGDRSVVMRPEMTPTVSRMVAAKRQELAYPLRLFSIPNCFRYERPQRGRTREFWQLNADLFGIKSIDADAEIILLADAIMKAFNANASMYSIQISSRKIIDDICDELQLSKNERATIIALIDKKEKVIYEDWEKLFYNQLEKQQAVRLLDFLKEESVPENAKVLIERLNKQGVTNISFNRYLARGFDYYTDIVFEVFDTNPENNRSMFGGGRYDGLVSDFGAEATPTVGFGMGDATLLNFLESNGLLPDILYETDVYIVTIGAVQAEAQEIAQKLRAKKLNVAVDLSGRKWDKQLRTAEKKGIQNILFVGEQEIKSNVFKLKNKLNGTEAMVQLDEIIDRLAK